jgi:hypothetical protein
VVDDLFDGITFLGHLDAPLDGIQMPISLTQHLDPVKGGRPAP